MAILTIDPNAEELLAGLDTLRLSNLSLPLLDQLDGFSLDDDAIIGDVILNATGLTVNTASVNFGDSTTYTFRISGSGFGPVGTLDAFEDAFNAGTANGTFNQISIDANGARALTIDFAPGSISLSSGNISVTLSGGFPVTLTDLFNITAILDGDAEGSLSQYGFTGLSVVEGGTTLLSLQTGENLTLNIEGYTLAMTGADVAIEDIIDFFRSGTMTPVARFYNSVGAEITTGVTTVRFNTDGLGFTRLIVEGVDPGTYYLAVSASAVSTSHPTGQYEVRGPNLNNGSPWGAFTVEEPTDAPASPATPYNLASFGGFVGMIDRVGDVDWIRLNIGEISNSGSISDGIQTFTFQDGLVFTVANTGGADIVLRDLPGLNFETLSITAPGGQSILQAVDVASFTDFLDELDRFFNAFSLPEIGGLGLAFATGDPHLLTHDGLGYGFHAAGEYVLLRATNDSDFEVQSRMSPAGENVTANVAVAVRLDGADVMIAAEGPALRINGNVVSLADGAVLNVGDDIISRTGNSYRLFHRDADTATSLVQVDIIDGRVDIGVGLSNYWRGNVEGLLGDFNGTIGNDLRLADGTLLDFPLAFGDDPVAGTYGLYGQFREDWRVSDATTRFTYDAGQGPDSFYLPDYPTGMVTLDDFAQDDLSAAEQQAIDAGLTPGTFAFNNAVLDLLITGDESFLQSAINTNTTLVNNGATSENVFVAPVVAGGGLDGLLTLSGRLVDLGGTGLDGGTVTFQPAGRSVNLTRLTRESDSFSFDVAQGASGRLDATRDYTPGTDPAITAADALDVLRLAVGLAPSFGAASAANFIAADINGDGRVTAADALDVLRAAVGLSSPNAPRWIFVDTNELADMALNAANVSFETGAMISSLDSAMAGLTMTGILLGNMESVA